MAIGKTQSSWIAEGTRIYVDRMRHYGKFEFIETPDAKLKQSKKDPEAVKEAEATILDKFIGGVDHLILLDEKGKAMGSLAFSKHLQNLQNLQNLKQPNLHLLNIFFPKVMLTNPLTILEMPLIRIANMKMSRSRIVIRSIW